MLKGLAVKEVMRPLQQRVHPTGEFVYPYEYDWVWQDYTFSKEDTYMLIFAPSNANALEEFKKMFKGNILFEGKKAMNYNHRGPARNTLVIFEVDEDTKVEENDKQV